MKMPKSIRLFEQLYLGSFVIGFVNGQLSSQPEDMPEFPVGLESFLVIFWVIFILFTIGIVALVFGTSRRKCATCKWMLTIITFLSFAIFTYGIVASGFGIWPAGYEALPKLRAADMVIPSLTMLMEVVAIYLLFRPDSKAWFYSRWI